MMAAGYRSGRADSLVRLGAIRPVLREMVLLGQRRARLAVKLERAERQRRGIRWLA